MTTKKKQTAKKQRRNPTTIDAALRDPALLGAALGDATTWAAWLADLAAAFGHGEMLSAEAQVIFKALAGGRSIPTKRVGELWAIAGRRSGKSRMAAAIAIYIALFQPHRLAPGEVGHVLVLSASKSQAQLVHDYCRAFLEASPVLAQQIVKVGAEEIELDGNITLGIHTNSFRSIRGRTILACVFDEAAYWRSDESANPDVEVYRAVKPALDAAGGMLIGISSPYRKIGLLATKHRDHYGQDSDCLVIQAPTLALNPTIDPKVIAAAKSDDAAGAASEWFGEFRTDLSSLFTDEVVDAALDPARPLELTPQPKVDYVGFVDASAGRHDAFTLAIGHIVGEGEDRIFVVDVLRAMSPPFDPRRVAEQYAALARDYRITELVGDSFAGEWVSQAFRDAGISYSKSELPKSQLYLESLSTFNRGKVNLPNDPKLARELRLLERQTHRSGRDSVDHPKNGSDDRANVVCGAMWLSKIGGRKRRGETMVGFVGVGGKVIWKGAKAPPRSLLDPYYNN